VPASPLAGKRVLIARAEGQSEASAALLRELGAEPVVVPAIAVGPPDDQDALRGALAPEKLAGLDWVIFTSANGVEETWKALRERPERRVEAFGAARFAVVGAVTEAALRARGATASVVAKEYRGEGLADALRDSIGPGSRVLLLRAQRASDVLPDALRGAGATVEIVAAYKTRASPEGAGEIRRLLSSGELDAVMLTSGSTVDAVCDGLGPSGPALLTCVTVACIGPVTAAAATARGVRVDLVPPRATVEAMVEALEERFRVAATSVE